MDRIRSPWDVGSLRTSSMEPYYRTGIWIFLIGNETGRLQFLAWLMTGTIGSVLAILVGTEGAAIIFTIWIGENS